MIALGYICLGVGLTLLALFVWTLHEGGLITFPWERSG